MILAISKGKKKIKMQNFSEFSEHHNITLALLLFLLSPNLSIFGITFIMNCIKSSMHHRSRFSYKTPYFTLVTHHLFIYFIV